MITGGHDGSSPRGTKTCYLYDLMNNGIWLKVANMNHARETHGCAGFIASDGKSSAIVAGGRYDGDNLNSVEVYSTANWQWTVKAPLTSHRRHVVMASVNNRIFILGHHDPVQEFHPDTNQWTTVGSARTWGWGLFVIPYNY